MAGGSPANLTDLEKQANAGKEQVAGRANGPVEGAQPHGRARKLVDPMWPYMGETRPIVAAAVHWTKVRA